MAKFTSSLQAKILELEGGYQNNDMDSGNYNSRGQLVGTKYGISAPILESWLGRVPSAADMKGLSQAVAMEIYKKWFWDKNQLGEIANQALAEIVFDATIQHGPGSSGKTGGITMLQSTLNQKFGEKLKVDGRIGTATLSAVDQHHPGVLHNLYKDRRAQYYQDIVTSKPQQSGFLQGWLNRLEKFPDQSEEGAVTASGNNRIFYFLQSAKYILHSPAAQREWGLFLLIVVALVACVALTQKYNRI